MVPSVVSIILISTTFSLKPDEAMSFWHGKSLFVIPKNSVFEIYKETVILVDIK